MGYNTEVIPQGVLYQTESWGWLRYRKYSGKVGIIDAPTIGLFDLALAAQAQGFITFANIGAMTKVDLDQLFKVLIELKQLRHFSGCWNSVPESVDFMCTKRVVIESMFFFSSVNAQGTGYSGHLCGP